MHTIALVVARFNHSGEETGDDAGPLLLQQITRDFGLGLSYAFAVAGFSRLRRPLWMAEAHAVLASFSYSLYVTHFPLMILLVAMADGIFSIEFMHQPSLVSYLYLLTLVVILYAFGFLFSLVTERHTAVVRAALSRVVMRRRVHPATAQRAAGVVGYRSATHPADVSTGEQLRSIIAPPRAE